MLRNANGAGPRVNRYEALGARRTKEEGRGRMKRRRMRRKGREENEGEG